MVVQEVTEAKHAATIALLWQCALWHTAIYDLLKKCRQIKSTFISNRWDM